MRGGSKAVWSFSENSSVLERGCFAKYKYRLEHITKYFVSKVYREDTAKRIKFLAEFNETSFREVTDLYLQI